MKMSLYGSIAMPKGFCGRCKSESFIQDGMLVCCDRKVNDEEVTKIKRESTSEKFRVSDWLKKKVYELQRGRCYLCGFDFNGDQHYYRRGYGWGKLIENYDHFIPKVYNPDASMQNIYLMCNLCNKTKGAKIFETRDQAKSYVISRRESKGTMDLYVKIGDKHIICP